MSESMIERVARAMKAKLDADDGGVYFRDDGGTCVVDGNVDMDALARAAIEAMREPTDAMKVAGGLKAEAIMFEGDKDGIGVIFNDMGHVFSGMIDAALNEHANAR